MYDITEIFQEIENQLISSMCRNLSRHIDEEQDANTNYPQWQTKQLQALERYRKENLKEFSKQFEDINNGLKKYLEMTYNNSKTATEHDIITNLLEGNIPTNALGVNQEKLKALIKSVTDDFQKAEYSLLRRSNDLYRQIIYKAQIGLNTGSITLNQAIDMATKDFLSNGINSIRYKNGNLVNIASYSEMALRTAEKRATMYGDGEKRQEWDIDTVIVYGHNGACPLCSRWQNRVYIDDVYSNGKPNNKYPLLSVAIQGGLYHPNCKCPPPQTYIEGITEPPTQKASQELEKDIQNYNLEQVQRYNERQIRKYKRLEANSLDDTNRKKYSLKVKEWQFKQRELINDHPEILRRDYSREKVRILNITESPKNNRLNFKIDLNSIKEKVLTFFEDKGIIKKEPIEYIKANSITEAEDFLKNKLKIPNVSYKGVDLEIANQFNMSLFNNITRFPKLRDRISFIGNNEQYMQYAFPLYREYCYKNYSKKIAEDSILSFETDNLSYQKENINGLLTTDLYEKEFSFLSTVFCHDKFCSDIKILEPLLQLNKKQQEHPPYCDTPKALMDHEMGHIIDDILNLSNNPKVQDFLDWYLDKPRLVMTRALSGYAYDENAKGKYSEAIAEAWAEYCNNPEPRKVALFIGEEIENEYKRLFIGD